MNEQLWWHVARASGIVAWVLLAAAVLLGLLLSTRLASPRPTAAWLTDLHRFTGGLALTFTAVHVAGLVGDSYVHFGAADVLVPFASGWRPGAVALGIVALYLLVAVEATSLMMRRLGRSAWHRVHMLSFPLLVLTALHGAAAGTDAAHPLYRGVTVGLLVATVFLAAARSLTLVWGRSTRRARAVVARRADEVRAA